MVGLLEVLKFREYTIFSFYMANLKSPHDPMQPAKCHIINILIFGEFFNDLNFMNLPNMQNSQNLSTSKNNNTVYHN